MACAMMSSVSQRSGLVAKVQKQTGVKAVARTRTVTKALSDVRIRLFRCLLRGAAQLWRGTRHGDAGGLIGAFLWLPGCRSTSSWVAALLVL
jgi:hypothetical protein